MQMRREVRILRELCQEYLDNIEKYNHLENWSDNQKRSDEDIIQAIFHLAGEKRKICQRQNEILSELLTPYEKDVKILSDEDFQDLKWLAGRLSVCYGDLDNAIALRIHRLLFKETLKPDTPFGSADHQLEALYGCGICMWKFSIKDRKYFSNPYFEQSYQYKDQFASLSKEGKSYFLRSDANRILNYNNQDPDKLIQVGEEILKDIDYFQKYYPDAFDKYDVARLSTYRNITTAMCKFREHVGDSEENKEKVYEAAQKNIQMMDEMYKTTTPYESQYYCAVYCAAFHAGKIAINELLQVLEKLMNPDPKYKERENYYRVLTVRALYIYYFSNYETMDEKEKLRIIREKIEDAITYTSKLTRNDESSFVNTYLLSFVSEVCEFMPYSDTKRILLEITVRRHKATYIHTQMVKEICRAFMRFILVECPEELLGINGGKYDDDIPGHSEEILELIQDMALLHDIGKYICFDVVSNASRRLEDDEFQLIRLHPEKGYDLIHKRDIPKPIAEGILLHHRWHDGNGGYPMGYGKTENQPLIDILAIADSLDAATDRLGRSYAQTKRMSDVFHEFEEQKGTRYGAFAVDLMKNERLTQKIDMILQDYRRELWLLVERSEY